MTTTRLQRDLGLETVAYLRARGSATALEGA